MTIGQICKYSNKKESICDFEITDDMMELIIRYINSGEQHHTYRHLIYYVLGLDTKGYTCGICTGILDMIYIKKTQLQQKQEEDNNAKHEM